MNTAQFVNWFENLGPSDLDNISDYYDQGVFFKDPFNELSGLDQVLKIFFHMFKALDDPKFVIIDYFDSEQQVFLTWDFKFNYGSNPYIIHGSTHLKLNEAGLISYHRDYWDVGE